MYYTINLYRIVLYLLDKGNEGSERDCEIAGKVQSYAYAQCNRFVFLANIIIHQIFSLARDWSKRITWANIPQLKLGNIRGYSPIFKTARVA